MKVSTVTCQTANNPPVTDTMSKRTILFASSNKNKLRDIREVAHRFGVQVTSIDEFLSANPGHSPAPEVEEPEPTYIGNALLKADAYYAWARVPVLVDDSGIEVAALSWGPGVISARYGGEGATAEQNNTKLLRELKGASSRVARMRSSLCVKLGDGQYLHTEGLLEGEITEAPRGESGWGYEPIFLLPDSGLTVSEMRDQDLPFINHRMKALERMCDLLGKVL